MIRRSSIILIEALLGIVAGIAILGGVAIWRLSAEPVRLDFLTPYLEEALSGYRGEQVQIGETLLNWEGGSRQLDLSVRNVTVRQPDGAVLAQLPEADITLSVRALLHGQLAATEIEFDGAAINLRRTADGQILLGADTGASQASGGFESIMERLAEILQADGDPNHPLTLLERVSIKNGRLSIEEQNLGVELQVSGADILLSRQPGGMEARVGFALAQEGRAAADVLMDFDFEAQQGTVDIDIDFERLWPAHLARLVGEEALDGLDLLIDGSITGGLDVDGQLGDIAIELSSGAGRLGLAGLVEPPLPLRSLSANAVIEDQGQRVTLTNLALQLGTEEGARGPAIVVDGTLDASAPQFGGDLSVRGQAVLRDLAVTELGSYWPADLASNARDWPVENLTAGRLTEARVSLALRLPDGNPDALALDQLDGSLSYDDLTVHFLRPLPPVTGVSGGAVFSQSGFRFETSGGQMGEIQVLPTTVDITGLDTANPAQGVHEVMTVDVALETPVRAAMELIDHPRLDLLAGMGLSPEQTSGQAGLRGRFVFPLLNDLAFEQVDIGIAANIEGAGIEDAVLGRNITEGQFTLELTQDGMTLQGPLRLAGVAASATWQENFTDQGDYRSRLEALVPALDEAGRAALGFAAPDYLRGPLSASITMLESLQGARQIQAAANLKETELSIPEILWTKAPGVDSDARVTLDMSGEQLQSYSLLQLQAPDLFIAGSARPGADGKGLAVLSLQEARFHRSDLRGVVVDLSGAGPRIEIAGGTLDAHPFLKSDEDDTPAVAADGQTARASQSDITANGGAQEQYEPLSLTTGALDVVYVGEQSHLEQVTLEIERVPAGWQRILVEGQIPEKLWYAPRRGGASPPDPNAEPRRVRVDYGPAADGRQLLNINTNDMGSVLRAFDVVEGVEGGKLEVTGSADGPLPAYPMKGEIKSDQFFVRDAPVLARLLTLASFQGIGNTLSGSGIAFDRLFGAFEVADERITTDLLRAYGAAVGLTAKGDIDVGRDIINLNGTVVPAYTINRILGYIPILGNLLTGGEGEGFIAVTYGISGPIEDPDVSVNPLSALAPGFLRNIFSGGGSAPDPESTPSPPDR